MIILSLEMAKKVYVILKKNIYCLHDPTFENIFSSISYLSFLHVVFFLGLNFHSFKHPPHMVLSGSRSHTVRTMFAF